MLNSLLAKFKFFSFLIIFIPNSSFAQYDETINHNINNFWSIGLDYGFQMSGIKSEDFISSNYSPLIRFSIDRCLDKNISIRFGYQGRYFNTIADDIKHYYNFYYTEAVFNVKNIFLGLKDKGAHEVFFHMGPGYFYNFYLSKLTINGLIGGTNAISISSSFKLTLDISAVIGWDIYQGNEDILPSISVGGVYLF
tara:strand:+ start:169 stop:753 length:585 start_codon:yes stop_codon:yes gene_type:complete